MFDTQGYYEYLREQREQEDEVSGRAPRSSLPVTGKEGAALTRMEKKLGRVLNYGEALKVVVPIRYPEQPKKRFIERARKCPDCGRWHTDEINRYGMCANCIPF